MTSTHCKSVALGRIIAPWAVKIAEFLGTIVRIILTIVEKVRNTVHELGACCRKTERRLMALRVGLSRPMMPKLKTMGRHTRVPSPLSLEPSRRLIAILSRPASITLQEACSLPMSGRRRRGSPTPPCPGPDAGKKAHRFRRA